MHIGSLNIQKCFPIKRFCPPLATLLCCLMVAWGCLTAGTAQGRTAPASPQSTWFVDMNRFSTSAHTGIKCEECHGSMIEKGTSHPDAKAENFLNSDPKRVFDYGQCKKCHKNSHERFLTGAHAEALEKEQKSGKVSKTGPAPTCGDCHSAHYAPAHLNRAETGKNMTQTCGTCHPDQKASFLANYHGKAAVNLGYDKSAFCTDCHGAHQCLSLKERDAALKACLRCHLDAGEQFADIIIHDSKKDVEKKSVEKQKGINKVHFLGWLSLVFVVFILFFFYSHSSLMMLRKIHEKLRRHN